MATNRPEADANANANANAEDQRRELLDAQRTAHQDQPRNFKDDALNDKVVRVEPDGTGPTSTGTFDPAHDQEDGSGNPPGSESIGTGGGPEQPAPKPTAPR